MNLSYQKRVASGLLKCGVHRVWVDDRPEVQERISEAVTRDDVRLLIVQRFIRKHQKKGISRGLSLIHISEPTRLLSRW